MVGLAAGIHCAAVAVVLVSVGAGPKARGSELSAVCEGWTPYLSLRTKNA